MLKVVLDTNIFVSALLSSTNNRQILEALRKDRFVLIITSDIFHEYVEVLLRPKFRRIITPIIFREVIELIKCQSLFVYPRKKLKLVLEDPDDNCFLEACTVYKVDFLVSGDNHLLRIKKYNKTLIIPPREFLDFLC